MAASLRAVLASANACEVLRETRRVQKLRESHFTFQERNSKKSRLESPARRRNSSAEWPGLAQGLRRGVAHVASHLQHVEARQREDRLELGVGLDGAAIVQLVLLDVRPNLLRPC